MTKSLKVAIAEGLPPQTLVKLRSIMRAFHGAVASKSSADRRTLEAGGRAATGTAPGRRPAGQEAGPRSKEITHMLSLVVMSRGSITSSMASAA